MSSFVAKIQHLYRDKKQGRIFLRQVVANWNELCSECLRLRQLHGSNKCALKVYNCDLYCCLDSTLSVDLKFNHYTMPAATLTLKFKTDQMSHCPVGVSTMNELFDLPSVLINRTAYIDDLYFLDQCSTWLKPLLKEYNVALQPFVAIELKSCASLPFLLRQIVLIYLSSGYI